MHVPYTSHCMQVCDRFLSSELPIEGPDVLRWLSIADCCGAKRLRARCVRALLDAQLQPPAAPMPGSTGAGTAGDSRLPQQLDPSYWKSLSTDAAWLLFESLLKACRAAHGQQPLAGGGLLGQVRSQLPPPAALEAWCGVGTLFSS